MLQDKTQIVNYDMMCLMGLKLSKMVQRIPQILIMGTFEDQLHDVTVAGEVEVVPINRLSQNGTNQGNGVRFRCELVFRLFFFFFNESNGTRLLFVLFFSRNSIVPLFFSFFPRSPMVPILFFNESTQHA